MAEVTVIAGVMIPSANKAQAPTMATKYNQLLDFFTKAKSDKMPPSPLLSALKVMKIYLKVVCRVRVQNTQEMAPKTNISLTVSAPFRMALSVYSGEVPTSP